MRLLVDTHAFLWACTQPEALGRKARSAIQDRSNELCLSVASIWEMSIKAGLGKLRLTLPIAELIAMQERENELTVLDVRREHALAVQSLPNHHRDPFDRMLVAQCRVDGYELVSGDSAMDRYGVDRIW